jgi:molybdate transport system substrate-binding protein
VAVALAGTAPASGAADAPAVAAAASLEFVLDEASRDFSGNSGRRLRLSFGSSGNLRRQIERGAPFELFLSADARYADELVALGLTEGPVVPYALGRLVLFAPTRSPLAASPNLKALDRALGDGRIERFAIANPEHAPYGRAAREALTALGLWDAIRPRLVLGENAAQAAQFAASPSTQGGIVPLSLALSAGMARRGVHALLEPGLHAPIRQHMVLLRGAGDTARQFFEWLQGETSRRLLARHGFAPPGD